jgi:hypothetical protein
MTDRSRYPDPTPRELEWHHNRCRKGWLSPWNAAHPIPCLVCKPHLRRTLATNDCDPNAPYARR